MTEAILIRGLRVRCVIGTQPWEREHRQEVAIELRIEADVRRAATTDRLEETVDYKALKDRVVQEVEGSRFQLLEALAWHVAGIPLSDAKVLRVEATVDKPGALTGARSVAVQVARSRT